MSINQVEKRSPARWRRFIREVGTDGLLIALSTALAFGLVGVNSRGPIDSQIPSALIGVPLIGIGLLFWRGLYRVNPKYLGLHDFLNIGSVAAALAIPVAVFENYSHATGLPKGPVLVSLLTAFFATGLLTTYRIIYRSLAWRSGNETPGAHVKRVLIVGAGDAGETILRELTRGRKITHRVIGLVDDSADKRNMRIHGFPVLGTIEDIPEIAENKRIDEILIALPSADGGEIRRVYDYCAKTSARVRTLPGLSGILEGGRLTRQLREVEIEDLLRREPVQTDMEEITRYLSGERVLITGGGGSIGSELARQIARVNPAALILVGKGENSIYEIEQELLQTTRLVPSTQVADVRDRRAMEHIFELYRPSVVFHAAAHKHVPLMQKNPAEAIHNNVVGTMVTADLAVKYGVKKLILISTDKAVNPSSVMGATKRICEMIVTSLGQSTETQFSSVRFGNVLGSRGSLIPLLKAQIKRGGPVTVTHKDMTRFFMTIPEAVQLVIQAGAIGSSGETFILDMGEPVRIEELAIELIRLHGLMPGEDIQIRYTGVRPGEKMHEELVYDAESLRPTTHPKIRMVADQSRVDMRRLRRHIDSILQLCQLDNDTELRQMVMEFARGKLDMPLQDPDEDSVRTFAH